jgi:hypothetical protein
VKTKKKRKQQRRVWLPGATAWECWEPAGKGAAQLVDSAEDIPESISPGSALVVPSRYINCLAFWAPTRDAAEIKEIAPLLAEKAGVQSPDPEDPTTFDVEVIHETEERSLVKYLCLSPSLPERFRGTMADFFTTWVKAVASKSDGFYLWSELGVWILGVCSRGNWLWVQPLTAKAVGRAMIQEIRLIWMRLNTEKLYEGPTRLTVWAAEGEQEMHFQEVGQGLKWMLEVLPRPVVNWPDPVPALMPQEVSELKRSAQLKNQVRTIGALAAVVIFLILVAMGGHLFYLKQQNNRMVKEQEKNRSQVEAIKQAASLWEGVEPALELEFSPLETLSEANQQLPEEGVRLIKFDFQSYVFRIEGEAKNVQLAVAYTEQLRRTEAFAGYEWSTPSPNNMPGGLAAFSIRATRPGAPEGEN